MRHGFYIETPAWIGIFVEGYLLSIRLSQSLKLGLGYALWPTPDDANHIVYLPVGLE